MSDLHTNPGPVTRIPTKGRLMSVALTRAQVAARTKTVTRRIGWTYLKPGDRLQLCLKVMGRKKGEPIQRLALVEVVSVRREPLYEITLADVAAEGFLGWTRVQFIDFFIDNMGGLVDQTVTRIEWRYLEDGTDG